jgi:hypothetical protein
LSDSGKNVCRSLARMFSGLKHFQQLINIILLV